MTAIWKYLLNQFLIATTKNYLKALKLAEFTDSALAARTADPFFNDQYTYFHPLYVALNTAIDEWDTQKGTQKGTTLSVYDLLTQLSKEKIDDWSLAVQSAGIRKGTPNYVALFPQGYKPFQTGEIITRINAVNSLSGAIALQIPGGAPPTHPLVVLKADVDAFYTSANTARATQQGEISDTGTESDEVEEARANAMVGLYAVLGACMNEFAANPLVIEPLFDLETLRSIPQREWNQSIAASNTKFLFKRTVDPAQKIKLKVNSSKPLHFAYTAETNDEPDNDAFVVQGGEEEIVEASVLGIGKGPYFKVKNPDGFVEGDFTVEIL